MDTLKSYFIGITIALLIVLCIAWFRGNVGELKNAAIFCGGFEIGAISATIASKLYKRW